MRRRPAQADANAAQGKVKWANGMSWDRPGLSGNGRERKRAEATGHRLPAAPAPPPTSRASGAQTRRAAPGPGIGHFAFERERERASARASVARGVDPTRDALLRVGSHRRERPRSFVPTEVADRRASRRRMPTAHSHRGNGPSRKPTRAAQIRGATSAAPTLYASCAERGAQCRTSSLTRMFAPFAAITAFSSMYLPRWGCPQYGLSAQLRVSHLAGLRGGRAKWDNG